jgi:hypothetical protein
MTINDVLNFINANSNIITALTAIFALLISTLAIIKASQDNQKQIVVGKVEEIYELIIYLVVEYNSLYKLVLILEDCGDESDENYPDAIKKYKLEREKVKKNVDLNELFNKVIRLHVLTNTYLSEELKLEVISYNYLFECLIYTIQNLNLISKNEEYPEGFPTNDNLRNLVSHLAIKLVEKINLGGEKRNQLKDINHYRDNVFKQKLKLK